MRYILMTLIFLASCATKGDGDMGDLMGAAVATHMKKGDSK